MASSSHGGVSGRIKNLTSTYGTDIQPIISDIRSTVGVMKGIAVQLEKDKLFDKVKEMEDAVVELIGLNELSVHFSSSVQAFGNRYKPGEQLTDFHKVFEDEISQFQANRNSDVQRHTLVRQFKEAVWNVHHEGQPMPGEENDDIVMTGTQSNILNFKCPLSGKPITELQEPVRSMQCRHIYEKQVITQYIQSEGDRTRCPIPGCPKALDVNVLVQDPSLSQISSDFTSRIFGDIILLSYATPKCVTKSTIAHEPTVVVHLCRFNREKLHNFYKRKLDLIGTQRIGDWYYVFGCMASRHIDGVREIQRYSEGKVYRRKVFKGIKINPNIEETVVKDENIPTTIVTSDTDNNNGTTLENIDEAPEFAVLGDGNLAKAEGSSRLEDGSSIQQQLGDQNLVEEHASSRTGDRNSPQQQLEELNSARPHASFQLADGNSPQQKVENQDSAHPQASLRIGDGNSPQQQLVEPNLAQPQASLRAGDGNSPQRQLEEENSAQPQASSRTGDGNLPHQQLEDQYSAQPPASLRIGDGNSLRQKVEGHNLVQPQASSIIEDGNSPRQKTEDQSLAQPPVSSRTDDGDSAQQQVEDQNLAQTHVSSRTEDVNSPRPQNSTQKDGDSPQILENSRPENASLTQPEVNSRLEDRSFPQPELNSKLEDRTSQQQDNSILEDGNSSQPQLNLRLEGSSLQPVANSTSEDLNLAQPLSQSVSDDLHINQQAEPSNLNVRQEDDRPSSPIHRQGAISDNLHSHQQVEPSNPDVLLEDDGPSSPIHRHKAVPSTEYRHSENVTEEPNLEDRIKINLASTSKQEKQEMCLKLESELDAVRSLVKRIEVKQGYVGGYGNSNVVLGGGITNGGGAQRAHSEAGSVGVSRQPTRPLHQLSFPMFQNSRRVSEGVEKEKRMPKANQFYHNSEFLLANDKFPPAESNKKSKLNWKKQGGGDMGLGLQMGSKFFKSCSSLLEKLMKHQYAWVFNTPVDVDGLGLHDYFTIITNPMDLGTVKTRLNKNWYKSPKEFAEDVRLTFYNAMTYNPKGQDVHAMAEKLSKIFEDRWAIIESDYNREMRYGMDYGAPSPLSRRVPAFTPPPPLDMRRILDRQEPFARTPRSMNNTPSSRTPAPKKPKAKDPNKRDMTYDEKQKLSTSLQSLPVEKLDAVVQMMRKKNLELNQQDDEIEVDFDAVDAEILWELDRFVLNYKKSLSKNKRKAEQARERAEALQNSIQSSQPPATAQIPREKQADERNVPPSLPMQGGSQADNKSRSSSSSSDSGSSSSDSDSDSSSSSGSDAGSQGT